jgi:hypothetical protein
VNVRLFNDDSEQKGASSRSSEYIRELEGRT